MTPEQIRYHFLADHRYSARIRLLCSMGPRRAALLRRLSQGVARMIIGATLIWLPSSALLTAEPLVTPQQIGAAAVIVDSTDGLISNR
ncbi:hypothetical protein [Phaeobacter sp.]|uniref:hypothetical protein n=1 Tax=Phaeobacter sp. TaxID=1902409 RepID=UPI0025CC7632|nr:hypothetical protein [Phaeobacter sp.]